jgi:hypothetical protein
MGNNPWSHLRKEKNKMRKKMMNEYEKEFILDEKDKDYDKKKFK